MARSPSIFAGFVARAARTIREARNRRGLSAAAMLVVLAAAPLALAQTATPAHSSKKKAPKAAASASTSVEDTPPPAPTDTAPQPSTTPEASTSPSASAAPSAVPVLPENPPSTADNTNTTEDPSKQYFFVGLRYRGTIIPQFLESLFVNEGATVYSNTIGAELDIRKGGQSTIPWIQYTDYNTGDILFLQKGQDASNASYYSVANSSLKSIYLGIDELWSTPIANHLDFEYGFGVGVGVIFGDLRNDWVYPTSNGPLVGSSGQHYTGCPASNGINQPQQSCNISSHSNATVAKVGGYTEPNWFNGGAVPVFLPHIAFPQLSLRYKPIKQLETRLSIGFSLTGFWFGLSADYGLEHNEETPTRTTHKSSFGPAVRDTL